MSRSRCHELERSRRHPRVPFAATLGLGLLAVVVGGGLHGCRPGSSDPGVQAEPVERSGDVGPRIEIRAQTSGTNALLQAVSIGADDTLWVGGHDGTWGRSQDAGEHWHFEVVSGSESLEFRDVYALDGRSAWLMSSGPGDASRIYRTVDAGASWQLQYRAADAEAFLDCMAFWDARTGVAFGDSIAGQLFVLRTDDGGKQWRRVGVEALPAALPGEGGFAASGTCVRTAPGGRAWIATGSGTRARVLVSDDFGRTWRAIDTPAGAGSMAGLTTLAFRDAAHGVTLGGDIGRPDGTHDNALRSDDGGLSWQPIPAPWRGPVYGAAWGRVLVAVGPDGIAVADRAGGTWRQVSDEAHWAVVIDGRADSSGPWGWAVGPDGRITALLSLQAPAAPGPAMSADARTAGARPGSIAAAQLLRLQQQRQPLLILDVRTPQEFASGHVPGAVNIPHTEIAQHLDQVRAAGDVDIVVYCRSGHRAGIASEILRQHGFERVLHLQGDMLGWQEQGLPEEHGR